MANLIELFKSLSRDDMRQLAQLPVFRQFGALLYKTGMFGSGSSGNGGSFPGLPLDHGNPAQITGILPDQHHGQVHGLDTTDHTGTLPEAKLSLNYPTHGQVHGLNATDHTGTLPESKLTLSYPTHARAHALNSEADHTGTLPESKLALSYPTHSNALDHSRQHSITSTDDHTFPGAADGTYLDKSGNYSTPAGSGGGIIIDLQGSRPASPANETLFLPTDGYYPSLYVVGTGWIPQPHMGTSFKVTNPPGAGTLTAVNQANSTLVADGDGLLLTLMGSGVTTNRTEAYLVGVPTAPYSFVVGFDFTFMYPLDYGCIGICLANGTTAAANSVVYGLTLKTTGVPLLFVQKYTSYAWSADYLTRNSNVAFPSHIFFRFRDNATTRFCELSTDGRLWALIHSVGRTDFITPTHCGLLVNQSTTALATTNTRAQAKVFHWTLG